MPGYVILNRGEPPVKVYGPFETVDEACEWGLIQHDLNVSIFIVAALHSPDEAEALIANAHDHRLKIKTGIHGDHTHRVLAPA